MVSNFTSGEQATITGIQDTLHMGIQLKGINAGEEPNITSLVQPDDPPILQAFVQELENWLVLDRYLEDTFREER